VRQRQPARLLEKLTLKFSRTEMNSGHVGLLMTRELQSSHIWRWASLPLVLKALSLHLNYKAFVCLFRVGCLCACNNQKGYMRSFAPEQRSVYVRNNDAATNDDGDARR
jgi:hypothetical protein